ncbi:MAG: RNA-binding protein [Candidatus Aenigmarchaeota archaeon]|nr:RNA-binding protein [Candidatus Aenigmarchaeota archaeon]
MKCLSCNKNLKSEPNFSKFKCPSCIENIILRCKECRQKSNEYKCSCGFVGP